jgi:hypothetical protein
MEKHLSVSKYHLVTGDIKFIAASRRACRKNYEKGGKNGSFTGAMKSDVNIRD